MDAGRADREGRPLQMSVLSTSQCTHISLFIKRLLGVRYKARINCVKDETTNRAFEFLWRTLIPHPKTIYSSAILGRQLFLATVLCKRNCYKCHFTDEVTEVAYNRVFWTQRKVTPSQRADGVLPDPE